MKSLLPVVAIALLVLSCSESESNAVPKETEKVNQITKQELAQLDELLNAYEQIVFSIDTTVSEEIVRPPYGVKLGFVDKANAVLIDTLPLWDTDISGTALLTGLRGIGLKEILKMKSGDYQAENYTAVLNELKKRRYLVYLRHAVPAVPKLIGNSSFEPGYVVTRITVYDMQTKKIIFRNFVKSTNSTEVETSEYGIQQSDLYQDLSKNYHADIQVALNESFIPIE